MVILSRSFHDLAMILTSVPCIMVCHDFDKGTIVKHDLARFTMIMARVPWFRTLGPFGESKKFEKSRSAEKTFDHVKIC